MARRKVNQTAKPFDATTKTLVEMHPQDWLKFLGLPSLPAEVIDADLATVTTDADRLIRYGEPPEGILHLEFVAGKSAGPTMGRRTARYNILIDDRHGLPVESVVILLQRESDSPQLTGVYERFRRNGSRYLHFEYRVIRLWTLDADTLLSGGLGTLPLTPIADVPPERLPDIVQRIASRLSENTIEKVEARKLWAATFILLGLKYDAEFAASLLKGVETMKESVTYQAILAEGREEGLTKGREEGLTKGREEGREEGRLMEAKNILLRLGTKRLGEPDVTVQEKLSVIPSIQVLEWLTERVLEVESWTDLL